MESGKAVVSWFSVGATQSRKAPGQIFVSMIAPGNQADGRSREKGTEEYFFTAIVRNCLCEMTLNSISFLLLY